jgi:glycosyltransferase involved in cell wall biosynthesis
MQPQVLFVSKPVIAPFNDGSKCFVRDLSGALQKYSPRIMVPRDAQLPLSETRLARVYSRQGTYRPALADNLRVLLWLLTSASEPLWHFVFAPNPRTSQMGRLIKRVRRAAVVQTIASPPRCFAHPAQLLFGDSVVAQSEWTKQQFLRAFEEAAVPPPARFEVIAPCVPVIEAPSEDRKRAMRASMSLGDNAPVLVYPGDLEVSHGSQWVAQAVGCLAQRVPNLCTVFAYRNKSPAAAARAATLQSQLPGASVRFIAEVPDMHALLALAAGVLFPVDDLYGKVDIPIVVLEAMHLGTPVVSLDSGPLADLQGVLRVAPGDIAALVDQASRVLSDELYSRACVTAQRDAIERSHRPAHAARRYEAIYDALLATTAKPSHPPF